MERLACRPALGHGERMPIRMVGTALHARPQVRHLPGGHLRRARFTPVRHSDTIKPSPSWKADHSVQPLVDAGVTERRRARARNTAQRQDSESQPI